MPTFDNVYISFLALVIGFGFLIFVHELGHFVVAKMAGIKCTQFAIGFGHAMLTYRKGMGLRIGSTEKEYERRIKAWIAEHKDAGQDDADTGKAYENKLIDEASAALGLSETEYRLNTLPLGGYVKMLGQEDMDPTARSDDPRAFTSKSAGARFWVLSAGVIMNLIFGAIFLAWAFTLGVDFNAANVGAVQPSSPAAWTFAQGHDGDLDYRGLQVGDRIVSIHGKPANDLMDVKVATALASRGEVIPFVVERPAAGDAEAQTLTFNITPEAAGEEGLLSAGIIPGSTLIVAQSDKKDDAGNPRAAIRDDSPLAGLGIEPEATLVAVDGQPVDAYWQLHRALAAAQGQPLPVTFLQPDGQTTVTGTMAASPQLMRTAPDEPDNLLGLVPAVVVSPVEDSPAAAAGVQDGDIIAQLGTTAFPALKQVTDIVSDANDQPLALAVLRDGELVSLGDVTPDNDKIGVGIAPALDRPLVAGTLSDSPAGRYEQAHEPLPSGFEVLAINDQPVADWADMQRLLTLAANSDEPAPITLSIRTADGQTDAITLDPTADEARHLAAAGWSVPGAVGFKPQMVKIKAEGPVDAMVIGVEKTHQFMLQTYITLVRLIEGTVKAHHLRGPVGIVDEGTRIATRGFPYLLFFLGLISVNLAVINYLPIPIVDGGHIMFLIIEKLKGSPVSVRVQTWASIAGLALIGLVFLTTLWYDVGRLISS